MSESSVWEQADAKTRKKLPLGVKLVRTLRGHSGYIGRIAWSRDGKTLASPSEDKTIRLWDVKTGECRCELTKHSERVVGVTFDHTSTILASGSDDETVILWNPKSGKDTRTFKAHKGGVFGISFDPSGAFLATSGMDKTVKLWDLVSFQLVGSYVGHSDPVWSVAFDPSGLHLLSASDDTTVRLWSTSSGEMQRLLQGHSGEVTSASLDPQGRIVVTTSTDHTLKLWDIQTGQLLRTLEGHTNRVKCAAFSADGDLLASKAADHSVRLWRPDSGDCVAILPEPCSSMFAPSLAFHPYLPLLATVGSDPDTPPHEADRVVHIWDLDPAVLMRQLAEPSAHYVNAKVVLVGDTGVGKSGLSLVLNNQPFAATESTPGRRVWTFDSQDLRVGAGVKQTRETLLWDLAGQPGYRVIHQLHLNEIAVALVVFDARSETDPLAGVRHWERALRLAQQRQTFAKIPMRKFLVSARNDRGGVSIGEERLQSILREFGFDGYYKTSAKEGWQIKELREVIQHAIPWERLPEVSSSQLFADIKSFLLEVKETGRLLAPAAELYNEFVRHHRDTEAQVDNLRSQFETCIGRIENRDLIRRLTFGGHVLLQPELLDAYASAMVNGAKEEPDGLGSLPEEIALSGKFFVPTEQKIKDLGQEQLLLHATVEELVKHDLALRENADDGRYLVFPSQFNRDYEDAPEPKGKAVAITFDGPVQSLYSTLAVRLGHSGLFTTGRAEMWRNAAIFTAKAGGKCGLFLQEFAEGRGRLILFFDEYASTETRFHFEEFVLSHSQRRALDATVQLIRFSICPDCGDPVPNSYVRRLREKGATKFDCPCGGVVPLAEPGERIHFRSELEAMDRSADRQRNFEAFVMSAKGETNTMSFQEWAGGNRVTLAIVFTDIVGSTALGEQIKDEAMNDVRLAHFARGRELIAYFNGREVKTIGDSLMTAFRSADVGLDYALALAAHTGHPRVQIRAGIHIGAMHVEEGDVFGGTVNFAARVVGAIDAAEIWVSDRAKEDIDRLGAAQHRNLQWQRHEQVTMKGFPGAFVLWSLSRSHRRNAFA